MAATPRRTPAEPDPSTRERILDAAHKAFAELGFDGASTRAISKAAGVNQGLIPYYFGTKDALWREAVDRAFAQLGEGIGDLGDDTLAASQRERLAILLRRYVRFVAAHPEFVRMMNEEGKREGERMNWLVDRHVKPLYAAITQLAGSAGLAGRLPDGLHPLHAHYLIAGAVGALFHQAPECRRLTGLDPSDPEIVEAHADALIRLFLGDDAEPRIGDEAEPRIGDEAEPQLGDDAESPRDRPTELVMTRTLDTESIVPPSLFAHVVLRTADLKKSAAWYATVLGTQAVFENDFVAFLTYDKEHHRVALIQTGERGEAPPGLPGLDHFAYNLPDLGALLGTYVRLKAQGIVPVWCINHGPTTSLYYEDPDGTRLELLVDNFETEAELKGWMENPAFASNPIGVDFDPDKLAERYQNGDPIRELVQQGAA